MNEIQLNTAAQLDTNNGRTRGNTASLNASTRPIPNVASAINGGDPALLALLASNDGAEGETILALIGIGNGAQGTLLFINADADGPDTPLKATPYGKLLGAIAGAGCYIDSAGVPQIGAGCFFIEFRAIENFTETAQGTNMCVYLNQTGQAQPVQNCTLMLRLENGVLGVSEAFSCNSQLGLTQTVAIPGGPTLTYTGGILTGIS